MPPAGTAAKANVVGSQLTIELGRASLSTLNEDGTLNCARRVSVPPVGSWRFEAAGHLTDLPNAEWEPTMHGNSLRFNLAV